MFQNIFFSKRTCWEVDFHVGAEVNMPKVLKKKETLETFPKKK
jgi:hypothetical protein